MSGLVAVTMAAPNGLAVQIALAAITVIGIVLALWENGWLSWLTDRRVLAVGVALLLALVFTQTTQAYTLVDVRIYCEHAWYDPICWLL